ncbi:LOG family protein [Aspergillus novofumigatus IBT 16806]|uniref:Lysine decarboxylase-like protein n=1 Tax=Aspergillus novofumigatus (strain IBT 16806) TaxID=1392255 RepID=A0A2I1CDY1_ASPN1|nr:lysine decarboxylase-like protein [Aspergillus novofumigatus IBT 16806]PKX95816.1 lysine decarboxylase-like protein [Aspergillus novofumigatus IBT 16806]
MATTQKDKPAVVCVFCGSVAGNDPIHMETARALAHEFHKHNVQLVYGGGTKGLMGELARTLVSLSGPQAVHGVIPRALVRVEPGYDNKREEEKPTESSGKGAERTIKEPLDKTALLGESEYGTTTIVPDMHTRKRLMAEKEVMEMTTWNQLGIHHLGIVLLNVNGYWDGLLSWVQSAVKEGYIGADNGKILVEAKDPREVLPKLLEYRVSNGRMDLDWGQE